MYRFPFEEDTEEIEENEEEEEWYPREYDVDFATGKLTGKIAEGARAIAVWVYFAINIERYKYIQYSWDYGCEFYDLVGKNYSNEYIESEVERIITECIEINPYINGIENLNIEISNDVLNVKFKILTDYGEEEVEMNV